MEREYMDEELRRLATDPGFQPTDWSSQEVREFHRLVQCARAAHVEDDLRNLRLLHIEPDGAGDPSRAQATLRSGRTIDLTFKNTDSQGVLILGISTTETETAR